MPYLMNVDLPTHVARLHAATCRHALERSETEFKGAQELRRDGGWLRLSSREDAARFCEARHDVVLNVCRDCIGV